MMFIWFSESLQTLWFLSSLSPLHRFPFSFFSGRLYLCDPPWSGESLWEKRKSCKWKYSRSLMQTEWGQCEAAASSQSSGTKSIFIKDKKRRGGEKRGEDGERSCLRPSTGQITERNQNTESEFTSTKQLKLFFARDSVVLMLSLNHPNDFYKTQHRLIKCSNSH